VLLPCCFLKTASSQPPVAAVWLTFLVMDTYFQLIPRLTAAALAVRITEHDSLETVLRLADKRAATTIKAAQMRAGLDKAKMSRSRNVEVLLQKLMGNDFQVWLTQAGAGDGPNAGAPDATDAETKDQEPPVDEDGAGGADAAAQAVVRTPTTTGVGAERERQDPPVPVAKRAPIKLNPDGKAKLAELVLDGMDVDEALDAISKEPSLLASYRSEGRVATLGDRTPVGQVPGREGPPLMQDADKTRKRKAAATAPEKHAKTKKTSKTRRNAGGDGDEDDEDDGDDPSVIVLDSDKTAAPKKKKKKSSKRKNSERSRHEAASKASSGSSRRRRSRSSLSSSSSSTSSSSGGSSDSSDTDGSSSEDSDGAKSSAGHRKFEKVCDRVVFVMGGAAATMGQDQRPARRCSVDEQRLVERRRERAASQPPAAAPATCSHPSGPRQQPLHVNGQRSYCLRSPARAPRRTPVGWQFLRQQCLICALCDHSWHRCRRVRRARCMRTSSSRW
jgi:hypothetical protein